MLCRGFALTAVFWANVAVADQVAVAVSSDFLPTAEKIAAAFEADTGHDVVLTGGSTGQLFTAISEGGGFDVFLAADEDRPRRLAEAGLAVETRLYALGGLALVSRAPIETGAVAEAFANRTAALADPIAVPYGRAATFAMERLGLDTASFRPLMVANLGQVATLFRGGEADLAFVSVAQLDGIDAPHELRLDAFSPEVQHHAALLSDRDAARAFWDWLQRPDALTMISASGYRTP